MICPNIQALSNVEPDICVIGAGPVGIPLALELARRGKTVLLLESGSTAVRKDLQLLSETSIMDLKQHFSMDLAMQRRLGGTSNLWGGRCVPMDALDFEPRALLNQCGWPITATDVQPFLPLACDYLGCGEAVFETSIPTLNNSRADFRSDCLERWSLCPNLRTAWILCSTALLAKSGAPAPAGADQSDSAARIPLDSRPEPWQRCCLPRLPRPFVSAFGPSLGSGDGAPGLLGRRYCSSRSALAQCNEGLSSPRNFLTQVRLPPLYSSQSYSRLLRALPCLPLCSSISC
jgi:hypothetical protein